MRVTRRHAEIAGIVALCALIIGAILFVTFRAVMSDPYKTSAQDVQEQLAGEIMGVTPIEPSHEFASDSDPWFVPPIGSDDAVGPDKRVKAANMKNSDSPKVWDQKSTFNFDFVDKLWFDCPDGRNATLTYKEMNKFVPCINGSALLHLKNGKLSIDPKMSSNPAGVRLYNSPSVSLDPQLRDWYITLWRARDDDTISHVDYEGTMVNYQFESYVRVNGGEWKIVRDLAHKTWNTDDTVDIVLTWVDPVLPRNVDAPVPFDWKSVPVNSWFLVRN